MTLTGYVYKCSGGETFDSIAGEIYGEERYSADLLNANPEHCGTIVFEGGETLYIPVVDMPDTEEDETITEPITAPWRE